MTNLSVQSSVSLQHLPFDADAEVGVLAPPLLGRLSFAKQKLGEIVRAARTANTDGDGSGTKAGRHFMTPGVHPAEATCLR